MATVAETKLDQFLQWLHINGVQLPGCKIKYSDTTKGFGLFPSAPASDGVLLVVPLALAVTPMRVLEDPLVGPACRAMLAEGEVDDRFMMILLLTVERLRKNSSWKPYLDMLPRSFGSPHWFNDEEFEELKGTTLYRACMLQKNSLLSVFEDKVKDLVKRLLILAGESESEVQFEDFLWANSVFWTRAMNIPLPKSFVFPESEQGAHDSDTSKDSTSREAIAAQIEERRAGFQGNSSSIGGAVNANSMQGDTLWVEGLVPGIDFCNHDVKAAATWEVDRTGSTSGLPFSMYLASASLTSDNEEEILISYGNKGNEELLFLYGFVIEDNPDDYLMVHYPAEALRDIPFSESKVQLIRGQNAELRCLLPIVLLNHGFFQQSNLDSKNITNYNFNKACNSWSGQRKTPSYIDKLVFPEGFMASLRTLAMQEHEIFKVQSLLEELLGTDAEREPTEAEVRAAVWEACGDSGALQLLVELLNTKMMNLEEGSGTEESDTRLLEELMSRNRWASIVYRRGQKQLTRRFLREAEHALQLCLDEES